MKHWFLIPAMSCIMVASTSAPEHLHVPFVQQKENGCGAATVAMVAQYWEAQSDKPGKSPSPEKIYQDLYDPERKGILLAEMKRYLQDLGLHAFTIRGEWTDLEQHINKGRPIIVGLKDGRAKRIHFAVVLGADDKYVWLNDPTRKKESRQKQSKFVKQWASADRWMLLTSPSSIQ